MGNDVTDLKLQKKLITVNLLHKFKQNSVIYSFICIIQRLLNNPSMQDRYVFQLLYAKGKLRKMTG